MIIHFKYMMWELCFVPRFFEVYKPCTSSKQPVKKVQQKCSYYVQRRTPQAFLYYDEYLTFIQYTRRFESRNSHDIALVFSKNAIFFAEIIPMNISNVN